MSSAITSRRSVRSLEAVIGVDGGGSRCRLALEIEGQRFQTEVGPCNLSSDFQRGINEIERGLHVLSEEAGRDLKRVPAVLALAGVVSEDIASRAASALPLAGAWICGDREAAMRGALGTRDGAVLHAGTGSFVGLQRDGILRYAGGWGPTLGDEGSGFWIGREAIRYAMKVAEGRAEAGALARDLLAAHGDGPALLSYAANCAPTEIAAHAPAVFDCAESDPRAREILLKAASELSDLLAQISEGEVSRICLTGGVAPHLGPYFPRAVQAKLSEPCGTPLDGALAMARDWAQAT